MFLDTFNKILQEKKAEAKGEPCCKKCLRIIGKILIFILVIFFVSPVLYSLYNQATSGKKEPANPTDTAQDFDDAGFNDFFNPNGSESNSTLN